MFSLFCGFTWLCFSSRKLCLGPSILLHHSFLVVGPCLLCLAHGDTLDAPGAFQLCGRSEPLQRLSPDVPPLRPLAMDSMGPACSPKEEWKRSDRPKEGGRLQGLFRSIRRGNWGEESLYQFTIQKYPLDRIWTDKIAKDGRSS